MPARQQLDFGGVNSSTNCAFAGTATSSKPKNEISNRHRDILFPLEMILHTSAIARMSCMVRFSTFRHNRSSWFSDAFEDDGDALAYADAHGAKGVASVGAQELIERRGDQARAAGTERVADGDGSAIGIDVRGVVWDSQITQNRQGLRGKGFVQLDDLHLRELQATFCQNLTRGRGGSHAHDAGSHARGGTGDNTSLGGEPVTLYRGFRCQEQGAGTVIHAGSVSCSNRAVWLHDGLQFGKSFERGVGAGMLVFGEEHGVALFLRDGDGNNFLAHAAGANGVGGALLAAEGEEVLILATDVKFFGYDFAGFRHGVGTVLRFHERIDEAPADGGVLEFRGARESAVGFGHDERSARHAFHATGDHKVGFARLNGARGDGDRVHTGAAEAVYGVARNLFG